MPKDRSEGLVATTPVQKAGPHSLSLIIPYPIVRDLEIDKGDFFKVRREGVLIIYEKI